VVAAVGEQHGGRARAEIVERVEQRLAQIRVRCGAAPMEEHEQRPVPVAGRSDQDLV